MEITRSVETSAPVGKVFAYLTDFTTTNDWDPGTVETTLVSGTGGVGTTYHNVSTFAGRRTELDYVVTAVEPDRRIVLEGNNKTVRATDTMTFTATGSGGTRVTYHADFAFKGVVGTVAPLLSPVLAVAFKRLGDQAQRGLETALARL
jgi:uncharacterized protein YndB with AHSA1/START domain